MGLPMPKPARPELVPAFQQVAARGPLIARFIGGLDDYMFLQAGFVSVAKATARVGGHYTVFSAAFALVDVAAFELTLGKRTGVIEVLAAGVTKDARVTPLKTGKVANAVFVPKEKFEEANWFVRECLNPALSAAKRATSGSAPDALEQLERLAALRAGGVVTDAEFEVKKAELLARKW